MSLHFSLAHLQLRQWLHQKTIIGRQLLTKQIHVKKALKTCGYPNWTYIKSAKLHRKEGQIPTREDENDKQNTITPYVAGLSDKLRRIVSKPDIPVYFKPSHTLRRKLVETLKHKISNIVKAVQCSEECLDLYIGQTKWVARYKKSNLNRTGLRCTSAPKRERFELKKASMSTGNDRHRTEEVDHFTNFPQPAMQS